MNDPDSELIDRLLEELTVRLRAGQLPSIAEYEANYPQCAAQIREFFPAVLAMERIAVRRQQQSGAAANSCDIPAQLGDFRILREIGRGGMGIVYEAEQLSLSRHVAVKVLPRSALLHQVALERFDREARTAANLHHTNIVPVFGVGEHEGLHYIVMQLIQGVGLDCLISRGQLPSTTVLTRADAAAPTEPQSQPVATAGPRQTPDNLSPSHPLYWQTVARIGMQAGSALHYAHERSTLHRDIKPANLLVDDRGIVWVTDFGLAKAMEHEALSQTGDVVGTLRYMAPERFQGACDARSDIYSLGLTLYELLTQRPAYEPSTPSLMIRRITEERPVRPRVLNAAIPQDLETIVLKAMAPDPAHRYATAAELADDLGRFLDDRPIRARRLGPAERAWRWARRNRVVASLIGLAAALLIAVAVVATVGYLQVAKANRDVRDAFASESKQHAKAEAVSALTMKALDDIFEQYVPDRVAADAELAIGDSEGSSVRLSGQPVLSKGAAALLERMLTFYDRLAQESVFSAVLRQKVADANRRVGDIHRRLGHFEQAKAAYLKAIDGYEHLQTQAGDEAVPASEIAKVYNELGDLHWAARRQNDGRGFHEKALDILAAARTEQPSRPQHQYELARTHYFLGRGRPPEAAPGRGSQDRDHERRDNEPARPNRSPAEDVVALQEATRILEPLIQAHPSVAAYRHLLACCYRDLPGPTPGASPTSDVDSVDKAIEILERLAADFPDVPEYRFDLAKTYGRDVSGEQPSNAAEKRLHKSLAILEKLVAENPNVPEYAAAEVQILYLQSELLRHTRRPEEAETVLRKALTLQSSLVQQYPAANSYVVWKAILQESLAKFLSDRDRTREARSLLESAVADLNQVLPSEPQAAYVHEILGRCYKNLSDVLRQVGDEQQADEMLRRGREHRRPQ